MSNLSALTIAEIQQRASKRSLEPDAYITQLFLLEQQAQPLPLNYSQSELALILKRYGVQVPDESPSYRAMPQLTLSSNTMGESHIALAVRIMLQAAGIEQFTYTVQSSVNGVYDEFVARLGDERSTRDFAYKLLRGRITGSFLALAGRF
jgi:hypothetical protein